METSRVRGGGLPSVCLRNWARLRVDGSEAQAADELVGRLFFLCQPAAPARDNLAGAAGWQRRWLSLFLERLFFDVVLR